MTMFRAFFFFILLANGHTPPLCYSLFITDFYDMSEVYDAVYLAYERKFR